MHLQLSTLIPVLRVLLLPALTTAAFPPSCPSPALSRSNTTLGVCPQDFSILGGALHPVHESVWPPTGLAVDAAHRLYLTYPRNDAFGPPPENNVVVATNFTHEAPWPDAAVQNCAEGQDPATCFVNVQNVVLDSNGWMWVVDSGIPPGAHHAVCGGAKLMAFDTETGKLLKTVVFPADVLAHGMNANDVRFNASLGAAGVAFVTDESKWGSLLAIDLATGQAARRLFNTSVVRADPGFVGSYNGEPIYCWNGTRKGFCTTGADGIALQGGSVYWGVLASRRWYAVPQAVLADFDGTYSEEDVRKTVVDPGEMGSEQAGFTADDRGRVYMLASEQNAIYSANTEGEEELVVRTLLRSGEVQHADSAAILDGWLYFCTNQLSLGPGRQYGNRDNRRGPFRSYRYWIGAGPAV